MDSRGFFFYDREMFEWLKFKYAMIFGRPYFGPIMMARQGRVVRHGYMQELVKLECKRLGSHYAEASRDDLKYEILEVGSWAGGSTITFAEAIKKFNAGKGKVVAVDAWRSFHGEHIDKPSLAVMEKALKEEKIFDLFLHNIKSASVAELVEIKRGWSRDILPLLTKESFDLIFIDGSHFYEDVLLDLRNSAILLKEGGILCGDDLELQFNEVNTGVLEKNKHNDSLLDPTTQKKYHPGVTLAVHEFFGQRVSSWKGFWAMRKKEQNWEIVSYKDMDEGRVVIPRHLK